MISKTALKAATILKGLALGVAGLGGTALVGGGGYLAGSHAGEKAGARKTSNVMARQFSVANAKENQQIRSSFNKFNVNENKLIARRYLMLGLKNGYRIRQNQETSKTAEDFYNECFEDEMSKIASV